MRHYTEGEGGGEAADPRDAMVKNLIRSSRQNAAALNFGRVAFPEGDDSDATELGRARKLSKEGRAAMLESLQQRRRNKKFGNALDKLSEESSKERELREQESTDADDNGFEVAAASQAAWNEAMKVATRKNGGKLEATDKEIDATKVHTSIVLDEAEQAAEVITPRNSKLKKREQHRYDGDLWVGGRGASSTPA